MGGIRWLTERMTPDPPSAAVATIVAADAVDKLDALAVISRTLGAPVRGGGTASPTIALADGLWIQIDIPKFGEPPPLAIDVHAVAGPAAARREALELMRRLAEATDWTLTPAFSREPDDTGSPTPTYSAE
jgi:hypothetical protein